MSASLKTWLYGLFGAEAHFYSVNAQRNCLSAASRGAQHVVGWAARWCSDSLLVKPVEGGDNPRTHGVLRAAGRAACGGRQDAMDLPSLRGFHSPGKIAWRTHRCTICMQVGTCNEDKRVTPFSHFCRHGFLSLGALRISQDLSTSWCRERSVGSADPSARLGLFFGQRAHTKAPTLDCLPSKGIMIFSDMSTGTNSPKVHPPNGTRFYTFQASSLRFLLYCATTLSTASSNAVSILLVVFLCCFGKNRSFM